MTVLNAYKGLEIGELDPWSCQRSDHCLFAVCKRSWLCSKGLSNLPKYGPQSLEADCAIKSVFFFLSQTIHYSYGA